jgi:hypothetical protein
VTAGVPPVQEIGFGGIEDTAPAVTASPALWHGGRTEVAKHRRLADAQLGGDGIARPALLGQGLHLLVALDPAGPPLSCLLLSGRGRRWDRDGDGAVDQGDSLMTEGIVDGGACHPRRVEHLLAGLPQILEQVKSVGDRRGRGCPVARPISIGSGPIPGDDLHPRVGRQPLRQGLSLPVEPQGDRLPAFQIDQDGPTHLVCAQRAIVDAQDPWRAVAREWQAADQAAEALATARASQALTEAHADRPTQREPGGAQPGH